MNKKVGRGRPRKKHIIEKKFSEMLEGSVAASLAASFNQAVHALRETPQLVEAIGPVFTLKSAYWGAYEFRAMVTRVGAPLYASKDDVAQKQNKKKGKAK